MSRVDVLITGITGFVGTVMARRLAAAGMRLSGLTADEVVPMEGVEEGGVIHLDILDLPALEEMIARFDPQVVVHLAGLAHVGESWKRPGDYYRVNFRGTRNVLKAAAGRRVLFASSAEVYGKVPESEQPIDEERPLDPRSPYAMTKACAEDVARERGAIVVRSFNCIGPGQAPRFALPSFARQLAAIERGEQEAVIRVGDLSPKRDFLHVEDAAEGYKVLIERGEPGRAYNLASGVAVEIGEALERLCKVSGVTARVERDEARVRPVDLPMLCGSTARIEKLGWRREHDLDAALADLWRTTREGTAVQG